MSARRDHDRRLVDQRQPATSRRRMPERAGVGVGRSAKTDRGEDLVGAPLGVGTPYNPAWMSAPRAG
jgi:hypothetical protein